MGSSKLPGISPRQTAATNQGEWRSSWDSFLRTVSPASSGGCVTLLEESVLCHFHINELTDPCDWLATAIDWWERHDKGVPNNWFCLTE